jgi:ribosomal protein L24
MKVGQKITGTHGDKKGLSGIVLQIDTEKQRAQVEWPRGYMKTWNKIITLN